MSATPHTGSLPELSRSLLSGNPARAKGQPAAIKTLAGGSGGRGAAGARGGKGRQGRAAAPLTTARWTPSVGRQSTSRSASSEGYSDYSEQSLALEDQVDGF